MKSKGVEDNTLKGSTRYLFVWRYCILLCK